jgi:hypothetical protein
MKNFRRDRFSGRQGRLGTVIIIVVVVAIIITLTVVLAI